MKLRTRLLALSVSTVLVIVTALFALHLDSLTKIWLDSAVERSSVAGTLIQNEIVLHITDSSANPGGASLAATKKNWNGIVARDRDLADMLVEQAAMRSGVIVEINVIGEDGTVIVSSVPSRQGQPAPVRPKLTSVRDSGFMGRLAAISTSRTDYESIVPIGILGSPGKEDVPGQDKPVFQIQLLASPVLLRDKILPELRQTASVSLLALLAAVGLAAVSAHLALLPVRRIGKAIDTLSTGRPLGLTLPREDRDDREVAAVEYKLSLLGEQMQGARRDADQMRTAIGSLARGVAHEIKNPLNAISLRLETLRMRIIDEVPEAESEIDLVSNEVHRLDRVVRTFLDLNRPLELEIGEFDPTELAATVLEIIRPAATEAKVELQLTRPGLPFLVQADRGLIEQGLLNIVNNAIQALGNESVNGNLSGEPAQPAWVRTSVSLANGNCRIAVTDNGPGMLPDVQDRIFEPNFTTKTTGSGIGLAFTKRAMELHRGNIGVESAPGHGTTMTLTFPILRPEAARAATRSQA
jgi:signal transduction histidine kinase